MMILPLLFVGLILLFVAGYCATNVAQAIYGVLAAIFRRDPR